MKYFIYYISWIINNFTFCFERFELWFCNHWSICSKYLLTEFIIFFHLFPLMINIKTSANDRNLPWLGHLLNGGAMYKLKRTELVGEPCGRPFLNFPGPCKSPLLSLENFYFFVIILCLMLIKSVSILLLASILYKVYGFTLSYAAEYLIVFQLFFSP